MSQQATITKCKSNKLHNTNLYAQNILNLYK